MKRAAAIMLVLAMVLPLAACDKAADAVEAVEELYDDTLGGGVMAAVDEVITAASGLRGRILSSPSAIEKGGEFIPGETYTGKAYYISNDGSDKNNGTSPESPFATVSRLKRVNLRPGDAVFFERGGLWRGEDLSNGCIDLSGVTVSAYGKGKKPRLYGSPENGAGEEKWQLAYSDGKGKKVWVFYTEMPEVSAIVLDKKTVVPRDVAYWVDDQYRAISGYVRDFESAILSYEAYSIERHLEDMNCFPELDYPESRENREDPIFISRYTDSGPEYVKGRLYFRCDEGNPGALYGEIEFITPYFFVSWLENGTVLDNLAIMYVSDEINLAGWENVGSGCIMQNCEIGYTGGAVANYRTENSDGTIRLYADRWSGGVHIRGDGCSIKNSYIHNAFWAGLNVVASDENITVNDATVSSNLVESCIRPMEISNWSENAEQECCFSNVTIEDNYVMHSGRDSWSKSRREDPWEPVLGLQGKSHASDGTLYIRNNVFAFGSAVLIEVGGYSDEHSKVFSGNTYIGYDSNVNFVYLEGLGGFQRFSPKQLADTMGDTTGKIYYVSHHSIN